MVRVRQVTTWQLLALFAVAIAAMVWHGVAEDRRWDQRRKDGCAQWAGQEYYETCLTTHEPD